jgi:hypothetical protein
MSKLKLWPVSSLPARIDDGDEATGGFRARGDALDALRATGSLTVVAPPTIGRRRLPDGKAERRSSQMFGATAMQWKLGEAKGLGRLSGSP